MELLTQYNSCFIRNLETVHSAMNTQLFLQFTTFIMDILSSLRMLSKNMEHLWLYNVIGCAGSGGSMRPTQPPVLTGLEAGCAPEPLWTWWHTGKTLCPFREQKPGCPARRQSLNCPEYSSFLLSVPKSRLHIVCPSCLVYLATLYPCLNWVPRHEAILTEWRYSSTHSWPRH
jgi:hypothetical protein